MESKIFYAQDLSVCPVCSSTNIESLQSDWYDRRYYDSYECHDCGTLWTEEYEYVGSYIDEVGEKNDR